MASKLDWRPAYQAMRSAGWEDSEIAEVAGVSRAVINGVIDETYKNSHSLEFSQGFFVIRMLVLLERQREIEPFDFSQIGCDALTLSKILKERRQWLIHEVSSNAQERENQSVGNETTEEISTNKTNVIAFEGDVLSREEFKIFKSIAERGIALAIALGRPDKEKKLTEMLESMEVRVNRLYPE